MARHLKESAKNNHSVTEIKMISVLANLSHLSTHQRRSKNTFLNITLFCGKPFISD